MAIQLEHYQMELRSRIDEVLHYVWDPVGVAGVPEARDEYDSCISKIYDLLKDDCGESSISEALYDLSTNYIGLGESARLKESAQKAGSILVRWAHIIRSQDDYHTR